MNILIVANYKSGKGKCASIVPVVESELKKLSHTYEVYRTETKKATIGKVREESFSRDLIICLGGDGTLNEVVNGVIESGSGIPVGYIPCGSTNDFATNYKLKNDPKAAVAEILKLNIFKTDIGDFRGSDSSESMKFCYVAATGAFSEASYSTSQKAKNALGHPAYILEGIKSLPNIRPMKLKVTCGDESREGVYLICTVSNSKTVGGVFHFTEGMVGFDDGVFEIALVSNPKNSGDFIKLVTDLIKGDLTSSYITVLRGSEVTIHSEAPIAWSLDGEYGGTHENMTFRVLPGALSLAI
jgi:diacylglycerol kinase (ATP)